MEQNRSNFITLPGAIIVAGALVAIAIIWVNKPATNNNTANTNGAVTDIASKMRAPNSEDHIFGNPNANIKIVEYSDTSCPYCKLFHPIMQKLMGEYGKDGKVAWIYRHFPLDKPDSSGRILHKNANNEAQALECAAYLGGNDKFWVFTNKVYELTPAVTVKTPEGLDQAQLPIIAKGIGLDTKVFNECLSSKKFKDKIENDYLDGINAGVSGTPYNVIILRNAAPDSIDALVFDLLNQLHASLPFPISVSSDKKKIFVVGALPYEVMKMILDKALETNR